MALLSIVVINYNTFDYTSKCLTSIYQFTRRVPFEIILVDNASTECNPQLFKEKFPFIKLICNSVNSGFAAGNNLGIEYCEGNVILLLNSDTELIEDSLSHCYEFINKSPFPVALTCKLIYPDNIVQKQCSRFPSIGLNLIELFRIHKLLSKKKRGRLLLSSYYDHDEIIEPDWIWGTFFMFKKSILSNLPGNKLDDIFFMYCEDMKWCYDFKMLNAKIVYLPDTKIIHHVGQSSVNKWRSNQIIKNELLFVKLTKGRTYQLIYIFTKAINLLSTFSEPAKQTALGLIKNI